MWTDLVWTKERNISCTKLVVEATVLFGRSMEISRNTASADICLLKLDLLDVQDHIMLSVIGRSTGLKLMIITEQLLQRRWMRSALEEDSD